MTGNDDSVIRIGSDEASLALGEAAVGEDGSGSIRLSLRAGHLSVDATADLELWGGGAAELSGATELIGYFEDLAAGWRGWSGAKEWNDDGGNVALSATHNGIGEVQIACRCRRTRVGVALDLGACRWLWVLSPEPSAVSRHASGQCLADDPRGTHVAATRLGGSSMHQSALSQPQRHR